MAILLAHPLDALLAQSMGPWMGKCMDTLWVPFKGPPVWVKRDRVSTQVVAIGYSHGYIWGKPSMDSQDKTPIEDTHRQHP